MFFVKINFLKFLVFLCIVGVRWFSQIMYLYFALSSRSSRLSPDGHAPILSSLSVSNCRSSSSFLEECYEILFLTSSASENGVATLFESGGLRLIATQLSSLQDGTKIN